jgi:hypothetical protein
MSDGYHQKLAEILRKAQGVTDAETGKAIDVGGEVMWLRGYCDKQHSGMVSVPVELLEKVLFNSCHLPEKYQDKLQAIIDKAAQE